MAQALAIAVKETSVPLERSLSSEGQGKGQLLQSDLTNYNFWKKISSKRNIDIYVYVCVCVYIYPPHTVKPFSFSHIMVLENNVP